MKKEIVFLIKNMSGGGAERVISILSKATADRGYPTTLIITHQSLNDALLNNVDSRVNVISLPDEVSKTSSSKTVPKIIMLWARILSKFSKLFFKKDSYRSSVFKYLSRNYNSVKFIKNFFKKKKNSVAVAFLYDSIFLTLLSKSKTAKVIISERGDPGQSKSFTNEAFMKTMFCKADEVVFQSPDAQKWYNKHTPVNGKVIFNPVKADLPEPYFGKRNNRIVNFCRISREKNLIMLVDAFSMLHNEYPEYELYIYGDAVSDFTDGYLEEIENRIKQNQCENSVHILPSRKDIHDEIKDYAMFVSSSDFEGMSNSMLEAMALGIPCVCTDCPAGGTRAIIKDGENGLLVPVKDAKKCYTAMKKIIESPELAEKISKNAAKIRDDLSVNIIIEEWMEIIND